MLEARPDIQPGNWEITATTIKCEHVDDFVTLMVDSDWTSRCVWYRRYKEGASGNPRAKLSKDIRTKIPLCLGPDCPLLIGYRDKLMEEETPLE